MAIFISYNRTDSAFVDWLAHALVMRRHNIWLDRWEMNVGDSLIAKIQAAITEADALLIILSKNSVTSEWCKKELNAGLVRELEEKRVLVLPCVIDDCEIPLFLREKLYADFRTYPNEALRQVDNALLRITSLQQGRFEDRGFYTDWSYDWLQGRDSGLWYFEWTFVDHGPAIEFCILTECKMACNEIASEIFQQLNEKDRQTYIHRALSTLVAKASKLQLKIRIADAFRKIGLFELVPGLGSEAWLAEISSRRMGIDNGKDTIVHVDQILERTLTYMTEKAASPTPIKT
jgi:hypothetical protein